MHQPFLLRLIFDCMGKLGQIGFSQNPCKILTSGTEITKSADGPFQSIRYQYAKNIYGGHFPTEQNQLSSLLIINKYYNMNSIKPFLIHF